MLKRKRLLVAGASFLLIFSVTLSFFATGKTAYAAAHGEPTAYGSVKTVGDTSLAAPSVKPFAAVSEQGLQVELVTETSPKVATSSGGSTGPGLPPPPTNTPNPAGINVTTTNTGFSGFNGISHADQRNAGTGTYTNTQFSLEPPDQGLCANRNFVVESVNNAIAVYNTSGKLLTAITPNSQFLGLAPEINRTTITYGPFISDPKCIYDWQTNHWFFTVLEEDRNPSTGANTGPSHTYVAVSKTDDPTKGWTVFNFDTTDDGTNGTPVHANCPCFGDQPLIGSDVYGFYVTTNEFSTNGSGFNGAQVYAVAKRNLIAAATHSSGGAVTFAHINAADYMAPFGGISYSIQPANRAPVDFGIEDVVNQVRQSGVEYFLSALQFGNPPYQVLDNRIGVWALTNTRALDSNSPTPDIALHLKVIGSETYGQPNPAAQKSGPTPLRDLIAAGQYPPGCGTAANPCTSPTANPVEHVDTNDDRMNQVIFSGDSLWSGVNTLIGDGSRTGIAYFKVHPFWSNGGDLNARIDTQGYVAVNNENVIFPSVAVNAFGQGVICFTLVGPDYYPSAAYIRVNGRGLVGGVHVGGAGTAPEDGFSGYAPFANTDAARWGDYSAAVVSPDGSIWIANEYIPSTPARTLLANWGTFVGHVSG
ncbi:MAG TPA: hypothetical protein VFB12_19050 [Ktedonobacteraceae bacterium]|nr:hypothetical protein [Ktedonobacteraceae bacterium]